MSLEGSGVWIIAEAGVNHNGHMALAIELVHAAAEAGADAVKFQTFHADALATPEAKLAGYQSVSAESDSNQREMLRRLELPHSSFLELAEIAAKLGIEFMSTAFDRQSLDFLVSELGVKRIKIPSGELTNLPDIYASTRFGLPMIISTGMATLTDIEAAMDVVAFALLMSEPPRSWRQIHGTSRLPESRQVLKETVTLLHCTSEYPTPVDRVNLRSLQAIRSHFGIPVGYSDHTEGITASIAAVALGATVIEKHLTLDRNLPGPDHVTSLEPESFADLVKACRQTEIALGSSIKTPTPIEAANALQVRKSLVTTRALPEGHTFGPEDITTKRPEIGLSPSHYWDIIGQVSDRPYDMDQPIVFPSP